MRRWTFTVIGLLIVSCTGADHGSYIGPDPTSTCDFPEHGDSGINLFTQGDPPAMSLAEIAEGATRLLTIEVIDVMPPELNTEDGVFPSAEQLQRWGHSELTQRTDVLVRVMETVSATEPQFVKDPGDELAISIGGGFFATIVDQDQALYFRIRADGPQDLEWDQRPGVCMTEGDLLAVLLVDYSDPGYLTPDQPRTGLIHQDGVLTPWIDGLWLDPQTGEPVDLDDLQILGKPLP